MHLHAFQTYDILEGRRNTCRSACDGPVVGQFPFASCPRRRAPTQGPACCNPLRQSRPCHGFPPAREWRLAPANALVLLGELL